MPGKTTPKETAVDVPDSYNDGEDKSRFTLMSHMEKAHYNSSYGNTCCGTVWSLLHILLYLAIPAACIGLGFLSLHDCTIEKYIPIYLIVSGILGVIKAISSAIFICCNRNKDDKTQTNYFDVVLNILLLAWTIAGSVWVYRTYSRVDYDDVLSPNYCDPTAYQFAFWIIIAFYIGIGFGLLSFCVIAWPFKS